MVKCKCIEKKRNKQGVIKSYVLEDSNGRRLTIDAKQLKFAIFSGQLDVINLKLTTDGKLVNKTNIHSEVGGIGPEINIPKNAKIDKRAFVGTGISGIGPEIHIPEHATVDKRAFVGTGTGGIGPEIHVPEHATVDKRAFENCNSVKQCEQDNEMNDKIFDSEIEKANLINIIQVNYDNRDCGTGYVGRDIKDFYRIINIPEVLDFNMKYLGATSSGTHYFCYNNFIFETNTHYILRSCGTVENYIKRHSEVYGNLSAYTINSKALKVLENIKDVCKRYSVDMGFDFKTLKVDIENVLNDLYRHIDPKISHIVNKQNISTRFIVENINNPTIKLNLMCETNINGIMYSINLIDIKVNYNFREFGYHITINTCKKIIKSGSVVRPENTQLVCKDEYIDSIDKLHNLLEQSIILMNNSLVKGLGKYI